jgi:hypothetical protein
MKDTRISLPELGLVAFTRGLLGAGIGLLLADRLTEDQRKAVGWALVIVGAVTTVPLAYEVLGNGRMSDSADRSDGRVRGTQSQTEERVGQFARS